MRISDWSSDVCSSDLVETLMPMWAWVQLCQAPRQRLNPVPPHHPNIPFTRPTFAPLVTAANHTHLLDLSSTALAWFFAATASFFRMLASSICSLACLTCPKSALLRSEEHTSELQSLMRISYAVFCLKTKISNKKTDSYNNEKNH